MFSEWQKYTLNVAQKGYNMILSSPWYLNMITYGQDWKKYYMTEPDNFTSRQQIKPKYLIMSHSYYIYYE